MALSDRDKEVIEMCAKLCDAAIAPDLDTVDRNSPTYHQSIMAQSNARDIRALATQEEAQ